MFLLDIHGVSAGTNDNAKIYRCLIAVANSAHRAKSWADAARRAGLHWLVLAAPAAGMTEGKWKAFCRACREVSGDSCLLIPGMELVKKALTE